MLIFFFNVIVLLRARRFLPTKSAEQTATRCRNTISLWVFVQTNVRFRFLFALEGKDGRVNGKGYLPHINQRYSLSPDKMAFTLVELLVVLAIIGGLAALLLTGLSQGKRQAQGVLCLNNSKELVTALTMYTADFRELFPPNPSDGNSIPGHNWCSGKAGIKDADEFNPDVLRDQKLSLLISYLGGVNSVFHCPGDTRRGLYQGRDPSLIGKLVPATRTYSMSQAVGTICQGFDMSEFSEQEQPAHFGVPNLSVNGPWLNNKDDHRRNSPWITYGKLSGITAPEPARLWVLIDEDPIELDDAAFAFGMQTPFWIDVPGTYHNFGCEFAFADGHSETHHWAVHARKTRSPITTEKDREDWLWMRERTSADVNGSMPPRQY
jgi:prepilin-type N-terminal cleavage/methylation domain-containing protein/prepilin-type processing-associated H-X9-DG protein